MAGMGVDVNRLGPDDWDVFRELRLEALRETPDAFGSTLTREQGVDEATWRRRVAAAAVFVARLTESDRPADGLVGAFVHPDNGTHRVFSMWVRPDARGCGVGAALVRAVLGWADEVGADSVHLWVTETNDSARRLYERFGFAYTGETEPLLSNPGLTVLGMTGSVGVPRAPSAV